MSAISGTRRKAQELSDGTLRVMIDIDPRFKAEFHRLFPNIDTPCAIAPLVNDFERIEQQEDKPKVGPLCLLAARWCREEEFRSWLVMRMSLSQDITEDEAATGIRILLNIDSRKDLDNDPDAAARFHTLVRVPFMEWRTAK